ncbi:radical SAM protein [Desulfonatronovibrio magnus]|uniref:radical SAM protein n=1 Tax=Desulfonatronovibrio magnus TaxID=698827 RepID=UPI0005EB3573|nr:radical SAM protein [Desulfonatronovibrio magnus]
MNKDRYKIDSHKLNYHPQRVAQWLQGQCVYPLYMEISPAGACNHRCVFCGLDFMGYKKRFLDTGLLKERLTELGRLGLKSVMYAGEGEPFLHQDMAEIVQHTRKSGIDVALTTNGTLMSPEISREILEHTEWIKISCNAGTAETYSRIHGTRPDHFERVMHNLEQAAQIREKQGGRCTLGLQIILLPENAQEIEVLARRCRDMGIDYLVVKPYSQHPQSKTQEYRKIEYSQYEDLNNRLQAHASDSFSVIFRKRTMHKWDEQDRAYPSCLALPFWSYMDAEGNIWGCSVFLGDENFCYGNVYDHSFDEIWTGDRRRKLMKWFEKDFDSTKCRVNCRMDEINRYLWELKEPPAHANFI